MDSLAAEEFAVCTEAAAAAAALAAAARFRSAAAAAAPMRGRVGCGRAG